MKLKLLLWFSVYFLNACTSYVQDLAQVRSDYIGGRYSAALEELDKSGLKKEKSSELLYFLEKSMILDRLGRYQESQAALMQADKIADRLFTVSATKTAASLLVNERSQDYSGEDYEIVAIHAMLALSFLSANKPKSALVEARRINSKLQELTKNYDSQHRRYSEDAFAYYFAGLLHEANRNWDDAIIDYSKAMKLYKSGNLGVTSPPELIQALSRLGEKRKRKNLVVKGVPPLKAGFGEVAVIHEAGHIATKEAKEFILPIGNQIVRFSFPYISKSRYYGGGETGIEVGGKKYRASKSNDFNAIAHACLEDRRGRLLLKGGARLLLKAGLTEKAHENFGPLGGLAANIFAAATETADTRSWLLLPAAVYVSRIALPQGEHKLHIRTSGRLERILTVKVKAGELQVIRART